MESRSAAKVNEERESLRKSAFCAVSCVNASGHQRVQGTCNVNLASKHTGKPGKYLDLRAALDQGDEGPLYFRRPYMFVARPDPPGTYYIRP